MLSVFWTKEPEIKKSLLPVANDCVISQEPVILGCIDSLLPVFNSVPKSALKAKLSGVELIVLPWVE